MAPGHTTLLGSDAHGAHSRLDGEIVLRRVCLQGVATLEQDCVHVRLWRQLRVKIPAFARPWSPPSSGSMGPVEGLGGCLYSSAAKSCGHTAMTARGLFQCCANDTRARIAQSQPALASICLAVSSLCVLFHNLRLACLDFVARFSATINPDFAEVLLVSPVRTPQFARGVVLRFVTWNCWLADCIARSEVLVDRDMSSSNCKLGEVSRVNSLSTTASTAYSVEDVTAGMIFA